MTYRVGIDIGGTFTDCIVINQNTGEYSIRKVPTTTDSFHEGAIEGLSQLCEDLDDPKDNLDALAHGTTVATNALIEREGVKTGLVTTEGFRDILAIGREDRSDIFEFSPSKNPEFVTRKLRTGVQERINSDGEVSVPLDKRDILESIELFKNEDVESIAVSLLHGYQNASHEEQIKAVIKEESDIPVSISSDVMSEIQEYERTLATVINAYVEPLVSHYISIMEDELTEYDLEDDFYIMQANGGLLKPENMKSRSLRLINSGPAAGIIGAKKLADNMGMSDIITLDIGGTSADAGIIHDGQLETTSQGKIGEDIPLLFPQVDIRSIGAGGGSIAWTDGGDILKVGPKSAGAWPGPVCYDRGGTDPTVTDAALVLGYFDPEHFLGGDMDLDIDSAQNAIEELGAELGMGPLELSEGIIDVMVNHLKRVVRVVSVEKGYDPRDFALTCFGGAGPMFATMLAEQLGVKKIFLPVAPGVLSALGLLGADRRFDYSISKRIDFETNNLDDIRAIYNRLSEQAEDTRTEETVFRRIAELGYKGRRLYLPIELSSGSITEASIRNALEQFDQQYKDIYGHNLDEQVEGLTWRLEAVNEIKGFRINVEGKERSLNGAHRGTRDVYVDGEMKVHDIYDRKHFPVDVRVKGPAIIEQQESTIVIDGEYEFTMDEFGNIHIELSE